jgi:hypothetical protein
VPWEAPWRFSPKESQLDPHKLQSQAIQPAPLGVQIFESTAEEGSVADPGVAAEFAAPLCFSARSSAIESIVQ